MSPTSRIFLVAALALSALVVSAAATKKIKCQGDECAMRPEHFKLYSNVKRTLEQDFSIKGKELVPLIRSVEVLQRRFAANQDRLSTRPNGTELVVRLLGDAKLRAAMATFASDEGRQLVDLYKSSINGNHQNLACSRWRVAEIEFASRQLESSERLAAVFANIHRNFLERSARKCLKSSCSSLDDNMSRLDSVLRHPSKRRGFLARDDLPTGAGLAGGESASSEPANALDEAQLIAQLDQEPASEFHLEELELCRFFKRSAGSSNSSCQASGNELSGLSFLKPDSAAGNETTPQANLAEHLEAYRAGARLEGAKQAGKLILAQCHAIRPTLDYHLFGLRWFQRQGVIADDKLRSRTFWCPSLSYWMQIERLCGELELALANRPNSDNNKPNRINNNNSGETFAY